VSDSSCFGKSDKPNWQLREDSRVDRHDTPLEFEELVSIPSGEEELKLEVIEVVFPKDCE
jgi:hypothetical protein